MAALGGRRYAFSARGWFQDSYEEGTYAFGATFDVDMPTLSITLTNAITDTYIQDDTLVAESDRGSSEGSRLGAYKLRRVGDAGGDGDVPDSEVTRLITRLTARSMR